jgi:very-short-patch-repair endonuclease
VRFRCDWLGAIVRRVANARRKIADMREGFAEPRLGELAARQHGVVARRQLLALGLSSSAIARRAAAGRLHPVHLGVYAVGHPVLGVHGRWMAAVLACGCGAALGYRSAAALWGIRRNEAELIDVVVPGGAGRGRAGLRIHRHPGLSSAELMARNGIPVTSPARTVLDLAAVLSARGLAYALDQTELQELTDYPALDALARARPGHRGSSALRRMLREHLAGTAATRSGLEVAFLELCRRNGLPRPRVNQPLCGLVVDFVFAEHRVAVETDSWRWHRGRAAFERDRERDALLATAGYRTLRFTDRQVENDPATVLRALRAALTRPASSQPSSDTPARSAA